MKIAVLGKGGSGKSTISWLITNYLASKSKKVLAVDADHNMDLTSTLSVDFKQIKFLKDFNKDFKELAGMKESDNWRTYFELPELRFFFPNDNNLEKYTYNLNPNISLISVGLGDEENMWSGKCAHGLSASLKFILPSLELSRDSFLVMDSVAGADMLNYGLYFAFDVICVVVESHVNSIKVAKQLKLLAQSQGLKVFFILNKYNHQNQLTQEFELENNTDIIAKLPVDLSLLSYDFEQISIETKLSLEQLYQRLLILPRQSNAYEKLRDFEVKIVNLKNTA
jgi:CO dehydrogenase maturation factor